MPDFHSRGEAGLRTPSAGAMGGRKHYFVVHHTAADGEPSSWDPARWRALEAGEVRNGYSSLAYHFGVNNGAAAIQEVRGWGQRGAATGGTAPNGQAWNDTSYACVLDAYCHPPVDDQPSEAALEAIADVIVLGVYLGFLDSDFEVWGHRDASRGTKWATACPGDDLYPLVNGPLGSIAARARYKLNNAPAGAPPGPVGPAPSPPGQPRCQSVCSRRVLRQGSSGVCVTTLQRLLAARGFNPGPIDGKFGGGTLRAVQCAQKANGLAVDGVVGPATWAALGG